jgi:hypothetical protein
MQRHDVIVRAFRGRPLRRVTHEIQNGRAYVSSERAIRLAETGEMPAVGFPLEDTFVFDAVVFDRLSAAWDLNQRTDPADWKALTPLAAAILVGC